VKITRPVAGILLALVIVVFVLVAGIWIASYVVDESASWDEWKHVVRAQFASMLVAFILFIATSGGRAHQRSSEAEALFKENGGWWRAMFQPSVWRALWRIRYPYAPYWMQWLVNATLVWVGILLIGWFFFDWELVRAQQAGSVRFQTIMPLLFGAQALPILYSKWRELSQPAATTSPEGDPS
jgi:hypothetical protein